MIFQKISKLNNFNFINKFCVHTRELDRDEHDVECDENFLEQLMTSHHSIAYIM